MGYKKPYGSLIKHRTQWTEEQCNEILKVYDSGMFTLQQLAGIYHTKVHKITKLIKERENNEGNN